MFTSPHLVEPSDAFRLAEDGEDLWRIEGLKV